MTRVDRVRTLLEVAFSPTFLEIIDESHLHAGHNAEAKLGGTHLRITIAAIQFVALARVKQHQLINHVLKEEFLSGLHALSITIK
ncbi:MAG: BolA family transcriptional regulator [Candidatus Margulisbacteria bacterium]|nr:BolA family transcriptional regulator [Candidatus Margulisiibacteriota bacterium]